MKCIITIVLGFLLVGCVCSLNWKRYAPIPHSTVTDSNMIKEDFVIQIIGTDHSGQSGLTSDIRGPYSIHTRLATYTEVVGYEVSLIELQTESGRTLILNEQDEPIRVLCSKNRNGLFIGRHTFDQVFDINNPSLKLRVEGTIIFQTTNTPFSVEKQFRKKEGKKRWLSFSDLMSV